MGDEDVQNFLKRRRTNREPSSGGSSLRYDKEPQKWEGKAKGTAQAANPPKNTEHGIRDSGSPPKGSKGNMDPKGVQREHGPQRGPKGTGKGNAERRMQNAEQRTRKPARRAPMKEQGDFGLRIEDCGLKGRHQTATDSRRDPRHGGRLNVDGIPPRCGGRQQRHPPAVRGKATTASPRSAGEGNNGIPPQCGGRQQRHPPAVRGAQARAGLYMVLAAW
jgi:hypothetical protein